MSFVYDYGGQIAAFRKGGKWKGTLDSPQGDRGPDRWRNDRAASSRKANKTGDEANPQQALVFAKGKVGSFIGNGWEWPYALDPKVGQPGARRQDRRLPDAEPHQGPVHADLPRRLRPRRPGHEQAEGARRRLDQGVHQHGQHDARWPRPAT